MSDDARTLPARLETSADDGLRIEWEDGHISSWDLSFIRRRCACATCNELRRAGEPVWPVPGVPDAIDVADASLAGSYGVTFRWTDGHDTGIYSWEDLRAGCGCEECSTGRRAAGRRNPLDR